MLTIKAKIKFVTLSEKVQNRYDITFEPVDQPTVEMLKREGINVKEKVYNNHLQQLVHTTVFDTAPVSRKNSNGVIETVEFKRYPLHYDDVAILKCEIRDYEYMKKTGKILRTSAAIIVNEAPRGGFTNEEIEKYLK